MVALPSSITDVVTRELKGASQTGECTLNSITTKVMARIDHKGGLPASLVHVTARRLIEGEVRRQFKKSLPPNVKTAILHNFPKNIRAEIDRLPAWICIEDGMGAIHVPAIKATPQQWLANAALKIKKADQARAAGNKSLTIGRFLEQMGADCLEHLVGAVAT